MCILQQQFNLGKMEYKLCVGESQAFFLLRPSAPVNVNFAVCLLNFTVQRFSLPAVIPLRNYPCMLCEVYLCITFLVVASFCFSHEHVSEVALLQVFCQLAYKQ